MLKDANHDYLLISYREDLDVLFLRWRTPVSSAELRAGYAEALAKAESTKARFWLFDLRSRGAASPEDEAWLLDSFFRQAEEKLKHDHSFAYLVSPTHYNSIRKTVGLERLAHFSQLTQIRPYTSEKEALHWLSQRRQALQQPA
ncbi:hypothetical protein BH24BAC1_BH24BAC1_18330 [soil metagenome]|jgi:hypothetical protein